jgi:hypothetical protein
VILSVAVVGCRDLPAPEMTVAARPSAETIPDNAWQRLSNRRILFGRQSVGRNILDGVSELAGRDPRFGLSIQEFSGETPSNGITHFVVGENGKPATKMAAFASVLDSLSNEEPDVAGFELCYLDFSRDTDEREVFDKYRSTIDSIRLRHPKLQLIHLTTPLTADEPRLKFLLKQLLGRVTERDLNAKRARYNAMLRQAFGSRDAVFDLAGAESTLEDGSRTVSRSAGIEVESLAPEYTDDGGHLNARGRRVVAGQFLAFLAMLP